MKMQEIRIFRVISGLVLSALLLSFTSFSLAEELVLFSGPGRQVKNYNEIVAKIKKGDVLVFSNGRKFEVLSSLSKPGSGNTTLVFEIAAQRAIRIPLSSGVFTTSMGYRVPYTHYISFYLEGARILKKLDVPTVDVYFDESFPEEYVVVEKLDIDFTYSELIKNVEWPDKENLTEFLEALDENSRKAFVALIDFAVKTWHLKAIDDFRPEQLGWVNDKWKLFDFSRNARIIGSVADPIILSKWKLPKPVAEAAKEKVRGVRLETYRAWLGAHFDGFARKNFATIQISANPKNLQKWFDVLVHSRALYAKHGHRIPTNMILRSLVENLIPRALASKNETLRRAAEEASSEVLFMFQAADRNFDQVSCESLLR